MKNTVSAILAEIDDRLTLHDFRMVQGTGHTNLIFDVAIPEDLFVKKAEIKAELDQKLNENAPCTYFTVITFDLAAFNG